MHAFGTSSHHSLRFLFIFNNPCFIKFGERAAYHDNSFLLERTYVSVVAVQKQDMAELTTEQLLIR